MTELDYLAIISEGVCVLLCMRICEWVVTAAKWFHSWLASLFPTDIPKS